MSFIYLDPTIKQHLPSKNTFNEIMQLDGEVFRALEGRATKRISINKKSYFIKQHKGIGFKEVIKNLLQFKLPIISAKNEYYALLKLQKLNILVPKVVGFGIKGFNPAAKQSFIITKDLQDKISLEDFCKDWEKSSPSYALKQKLLAKVANISRKMHASGINHRDFYICHFLFDLQTKDKKEVDLYLIDLHRAGMRKKIPERWQIKDLAGLYFSSKNIGLTVRDFLRFITIYSGKPLREILATEKVFWMKVKERGDKLYRKHRH